MGNKVPISDKQIDALSYVNFDASEFSDGLNPKQLMKLIKSKSNQLKEFAKELDKIDKTKCKQIVAIADKDHDKRISYGEFYFALGKLQDGHFVRTDARAKAVAMMEAIAARKL